MAADLPLGLRQRLSLAVALVHGPDLLILDEPTSGVDPVARDEFWSLLIELSRDQGVTIFMSTHFMNEAARCDRISLMDSGKVLATGAPAALVAAQGAKNLEEAFISLLEEAGAARPPAAAVVAAPDFAAAQKSRVLACVACWPIRSAKFWNCRAIRSGWAMRFSVRRCCCWCWVSASRRMSISLTFAALDRDNSFYSRAYLSEVRGSSYFIEQKPDRRSPATWTTG